MIQLTVGAIKKITIFQGDSLDIEFRIFDKQRNRPIDLNKYDVRFQVPGADILKTSLNPLEIEKTDPSEGIATVFLKPADTIEVGTGIEFKYDAEVFDGVDVFTFCKGPFLVEC